MRDVYLPEGKWVHFFTGERIEGGRWLKSVASPLDIMPLYVKEGAKIKIYPDIEPQHTDQMDLSKAETLTIDEQFNGFEF